MWLSRDRCVARLYKRPRMRDIDKKSGQWGQGVDKTSGQWSQGEMGKSKVKRKHDDFVVKVSRDKFPKGSPEGSRDERFRMIMRFVFKRKVEGQHDNNADQHWAEIWTMTEQESSIFHEHAVIGYKDADVWYDNEEGKRRWGKEILFCPVLQGFIYLVSLSFSTC